MAAPALRQSIFFSPKILFHQDRLLPYLEHARRTVGNADAPAAGTVPVTMEIDLTNVCSHRCPLCVGRRVADSAGEQLFAVAGNGEQMPGARAADYIGQMAAAGVRGLIFTGGGEPTTHPDLEPLVGLAAGAGLDVGLITHGGLLHKRDVKALVASCAWIRVSVDAATEEEFREVHGRGAAEWRRVWDNVSRLVDAREALRAQGHPAPATLGAAFLAGPGNVAGLDGFAARARDHGVDYAQVRPFHRCIGFDIGPALAAAKARYDTDRFTVVASLQKYTRVVDGQPAPRTYTVCHIAEFASVICANERMYVCCHLRNIERFCIGDLRQNSFLDILKSQRRARAGAAVDVRHCLSLCRGDHVNREVQALLDGGQPPLSPTTAPMHVNFL